MNIRQYQKQLMIILSFFIISSSLFAIDNEDREIVSQDRSFSLILNRDFYNVLTQRLQRQIPGANLAYYANKKNEVKLIFGQVIYLNNLLKSERFDSFLQNYRKEMQKTQPSFTIWPDESQQGENQFTFSMKITTNKIQVCRGKLFDHGTKILQVCGRTHPESQTWLNEILKSVKFYW